MNRLKSIHILICFILLSLMSSQEIIQSNVIQNNGSIARTANTKFITFGTVGQTGIGYIEGVDNTGAVGFWSFLHLEPQAPIVVASEGDYPDRIEIRWDMFSLSPVSSEGFKVFRDGNLIGKVAGSQYAFVDFDVTAGELYNYEVTASNDFGESKAGTFIGFVNPNGVITGRVETSSGLAASGAKVTLNPNLGKSLDFKDKQSLNIPLNNAVDSVGKSSLSLSFWLRTTVGTKSVINLSDSIKPLVSISLNNNDMALSVANNPDYQFDYTDFNDDYTQITITVDTTKQIIRHYVNSKLMNESALTAFAIESKNLSLHIGDGSFKW